MGQLLAIAFLTAAALAVSGCLVVHPRHRHGPPHVPPGHAKKVVHHHGPGCGHVFRNGVWVTVEVGER